MSETVIPISMRARTKASLTPFLDTLLGGSGNDNLHGDDIPVGNGTGNQRCAATQNGLPARQLRSAALNQRPRLSYSRVRTVLSCAALLGTSTLAIAAPLSSAGPLQASETFELLRANPEATAICSALQSMLGAVPELGDCPDDRTCAMRAQQAFEQRPELEPRWHPIQLDASADLLRLVPNASIGGSPATTPGILDRHWREEYEPSLARARSEGALRVSEAFFDVNYDGTKERFVRVAATDCPFKPTLLSCFSIQFVIDGTGQIDRRSWHSTTSNYVPIVIEKKLVWLSWRDRDSWGYLAVAELDRDYTIAVVANGTFQRGPIHYFPSLDKLCILGRK